MDDSWTAGGTPPSHLSIRTLRKPLASFKQGGDSYAPGATQSLAATASYLSDGGGSMVAPVRTPRKVYAKLGGDGGAEAAPAGATSLECSGLCMLLAVYVWCRASMRSGFALHVNAKSTEIGCTSDMLALCASLQCSWRQSLQVAGRSRRRASARKARAAQSQWSRPTSGCRK